MIAIGIEIVCKALLTRCGMLHVMSIHELHQFQVFSTLTLLLVIEAASIDFHQLTKTITTDACGALSL